MTPEGIERAADLIRRAQRIVVSTGAGMSKESGIPTFRDSQEGLWAQFDPQELATEEGFRAAPGRVWSWYAHRRAKMLACEPHAGHLALVALQERVPELTIVTQNIDGLHQVAGSRDVIELHGNIHRTRCLECEEYPATDPRGSGTVHDDNGPPLCLHCGGYLRPDVVWFGEMLPQDATERAWDLTTRSDLILVVGTSGLVWPAAELPHLARRSGIPVVEVNPVRSEITPVADIFLDGPAGGVLPALVAAVASSEE